MIDTTAGRAPDTPDLEPEHHEYHSAVEVDESVENWRDWVGPTLAILFVIAALVVIAMMVTGNI